MLTQALEVKNASAGAASPGIRLTQVVAKLIDTSSCIGCKACEVACQEWNDLPAETTVNLGTYQTLPDMTPHVWNLIRFNEVEQGGQLHWLMRKDQCMHCADPGCLKACPAPNAIVQYENGIVDFQQENCIGCEFCVSGCPFNIPRFNETTKKVYKCTLCSDRVGQGLEPACIKACPTGCLKFGSKDDMTFIAQERSKQLRENFGYDKAGVYDPDSIGGTHVIYVLHDATDPERYGGLPKNPTIPWSYTVWKWLAKPVLGTFALFGLLGVGLHYVMVGPRRPQPDPNEEGAHGNRS